ncbi:MAG: aspartyl/asparaginyl beta-hydroxylase domain-containing protein [Rhodobacteraceae bacterium]|nr:aspartyl/asparaginyl beta-hydroxylase domain-containing protein [Paracoccaceae bacterium]
MVAVAALDTFKAVRRKYVRNLGKPILRAFDRFMASQSLVPNDPILDSKLFPWVTMLEDNWEDIRAELDGVLRYREAIPRFQDVSPDQYRISPDDMWKTFMLFGFGFRAGLNCQLCPKTSALLEKIPGLKTAFFRSWHRANTFRCTRASPRRSCGVTWVSSFPRNARNAT